MWVLTFFFSLQIFGGPWDFTWEDSCLCCARTDHIGVKGCPCPEPYGQMFSFFSFCLFLEYWEKMKRGSKIALYFLFFASVQGYNSSGAVNLVLRTYPFYFGGSAMADVLHRN